MQHGFDLTDFGENWPHFVAATGLHYVGKCQRGTAFEWASEFGVTMITHNNPSTGEYGPGRHMRDDEPGFAGYIGLDGPDAAVEEAVRLVHQYAVYIKDECAGSRPFI